MLTLYNNAEYASVGYMAKRIQMRKNRFLAIQKMAEQKKNEALHSSNANIHEATNMELASNMPKQTVSFLCFFKCTVESWLVDRMAYRTLKHPE
jgi:hypothetical protein